MPLGCIRLYANSLPNAKVEINGKQTLCYDPRGRQHNRDEGLGGKSKVRSKLLKGKVLNLYLLSQYSHTKPKSVLTYVNVYANLFWDNASQFIILLRVSPI